MGQISGLLYSPTTNVTKKAGHAVGLYYICIYCIDLSFLTSSPYLQSTFVYAMRGGMELPAFLLLSSNNIQQKHIVITYNKRMWGKTKSYELYQYYEFGTYLTVNEHTHVWLICLNSNQMQTYSGAIPSTKEAPTAAPTLQISSSIPLPRPYLYRPILPRTISIITQKITIHLYFLSTWFVYYCDI